MDALTPEYLAAIMEADVPASVVMAPVQQMNAADLSKKKSMCKTLVVLAVVGVGVVLAGVAYAAYAHEKKKEKAMRLAAMVEARRRRARPASDMWNVNDTNQRRVSADDDDANMNAYDDTYRQSTYAVL